MDPDVLQAIPTLVADGIVPASAAPHLSRLAAGQLVSVHRELRLLLYLGVLVFTTGVGLFLKDNLARIGPLTIMVALAALALGALAWVARVAPPFSWQQVPSPNLAFDYVLLLAILLVSADLGYGEHVFDPLGVHAALPFLVMSALTAVAAGRFDSRVAFSFALTSFAAWRGVSLAQAGRELLSSAGVVVRLNALGCGALFVVLGWILARSGRKPHFEPVAAHLGWLLILCALASGLESLLWATALLAVGTALAVTSYFSRRYAFFAYGVIAAYVALLRLGGQVVRIHELGCLLVGTSAGAMVVLLLVMYRLLKRMPR